MTPEAVFVLLGFLLALFGVIAIAVGVVAAVLIGEGEVKIADTAALLKNTRVPLGADKRYE